MNKAINHHRIIITGGSGFIGTSMMDYLIEKNIPCLNIDFQPPKKEEHLNYWKNIDILNFDKFENAVTIFNPTYIIHLAASLGMDHKSLDTLATNIDGVKNLIKIGNNIDDLKRIIFTSSLLVCENGYIPNNDIDYCPPNYYGESKMIGEKLVRRSNMHCEWTIVRPTSIWGPWFDYSYKTFFKTIDKNRYFHIGKTEFQKPASFVGNTVHMFIKLLFSDKLNVHKNTFYFADYPRYSTKYWANTIQKIFCSKKIKTAPFWILKIVAFFGDLIKIIFKYDPPLTSFRLNNMMIGGNYPIENTKKIVGKLPYSLNESVFITGLWMYENKLIKHKPIRI